MKIMIESLKQDKDFYEKIEDAGHSMTVSEIYQDIFQANSPEANGKIIQLLRLSKFNKKLIDAIEKMVMMAPLLESYQAMNAIIPTDYQTLPDEENIVEEIL